MKNRYSAMMVIAVLLLSCSGKEEHSSKVQANPLAFRQIDPPQVTVLANLPDRLQPKVITLDQSRQPVRIAIPTQKGQTYKNATGQTIKMEPPATKMLPIRKNAAGQPISNQAGQSLIAGAGGIPHFTSYTTEDGLMHDIVLCSYLDREGHLWFGTSGGGVSRFDGTSFTTYTTAQGLGGNNIHGITQDKDGQLWFGGFGAGVSRFDGTGFTSYTTAQGLASNDVWCITADKAGNLWFGTNSGGVSRFDPDANNGQGSFKNYTTAQGLADNTVWWITQDQAGRLWFATEGGGVSRFDPDANNGQNSFMTYTTAEGLAGNFVRWIIKDKTDQLWFATDGGVSRFDPDANKGQGSFTTYTLAGNYVRCIIEDKAGHLWFGTWGRGVSRFDGAGFSAYTTAQGLAGNYVRRIMKDKTDQLWFGTRDRGVSRFDPDANNGQGSFTSYTIAQGLASNNIRCIAQDRAGDLWFGHWGEGASRFDPDANNGQDSFTNYTTAQGLASNIVFCITKDKAGQLWFGTWGVGVSCFDPDANNGQGSFTNYTTAQGLADKFVWCITQDRAGDLWFGTRDGGVSRFDPDANNGQGSFTSYTTTQGLASNNVSCITEDREGNIWFGTDGGLSFLSKRLREKPAVKPFQSFTTADGVADNNVTQVLQLPDGKMALGSNQGITLFDPPQGPAEDFIILSGIEHYNTQSGYPVKNVQSLHLDHKGMIWIGTGSDQTALVRFDYRAVRKNATPPSLSIRQIQINQEAICWHDLQDPEIDPKIQAAGIDSLQTPANLTEEAITLGRRLNDEERLNMQQKYAGLSFDSITPFYYIPHHLVLPYKHNSITFHYGTSELARPKLIEYQYQLEGYDDDWSPVLKNTSATFGNMWEGSYTFKLKARYTGPSLAGADEWTEPLTYTFRLRPPWFRSWWAYLLYASLAVGSAWGIIQWRTLALRKQQKVLEQTVVERTAEIATEQQRSNDLLLNILPAEVARELKETGKTAPIFFEDVSILFADFSGYTTIVASIPGKVLVSELDDIFQHFDDIMETVGVEKIQTIGDAYVACGGLPTADPKHAIKCVEAGKQIISYLNERNQTSSLKWEVRIGIHSGPVTAGVIGKKKFTYDIFGDTVNVAARVESSGEAGRINISAYTHQLIKEQFPCIYRGKIDAKGKGRLDMYFVD